MPARNFEVEVALRDVRVGGREDMVERRARVRNTPVGGGEPGGKRGASESVVELVGEGVVTLGVEQAGGVVEGRDGERFVRDPRPGTAREMKKRERGREVGRSMVAIP